MQEIPGGWSFSLLPVDYLEDGVNTPPGVLDAIYEIRLAKTDDEHCRI